MHWRTMAALVLLTLSVRVAVAQAPSPAQPPTPTKPAAGAGGAAAQSAAGSLVDLEEKAVKAAVRQVTPSVVQIETSGGTDVLVSGPRGQPVRKAAGPTTGVIVGADGFVISSAFNFANKPASIFVALPGHKERYVAKAVATDKTRMLTLLKIEATGLPVPPVAPRAEIRIGQTALALGKTLDPVVDHPPSVSVGIISALSRIWGKAVQTDAKVSPANYGGPLVDLQGRVMGILIPASPQSDGDTAGVEWYDSGIGFAIPLEDVLAVLPRLKAGKDLGKGILGISVQSSDIYGPEATVASVAPESAAAKAGIQAGDVIREIDGKPVRNQAQVLHALGTKYEGDTASVKVLRGGKEEKAFANLVLGGVQSGAGRAMLGILPMRDDPEPGVEVRYVYSKGPAEAAGIKEGDRIAKLGAGMGPLQPFAGSDQLAAILSGAAPGSKLKLEVVRKEGKKTETVEVTLGEWPSKGATDAVPDKLPPVASKKKALEPRKAVGPRVPMPMPEPAPKKEDKKDAPTGLINRKNASGTHDYWIYVPRDYDPNVSYALVLWLHPVGKSKEKDIDDFLDAWISYCRENQVIIAGPISENTTGWVPSESDVALEVARDVMDNYTVDRRRVVMHGMGVGGQLALYMAFHNRDLVRGVAATGAALTSQPKERVMNQPLAFFLHAGARDPLAASVGETKDRLVEQRYPVLYRVSPEAGHQYLDEASLDELVRWVDSLDRL